MASLDNSNRFVVDFEPIGRRIEVRPGTSLLAAAQAAGVDLVALCGGRAACGSCRVRLVVGQLTPLTATEQETLAEDLHAADYRLACLAGVLSDVTIDVPPESLTTPQRLQLEGQELQVALDPLLVPVDIQLSPPSLDDLRADSVRLSDALKPLGFASCQFQLPVLGELSNQLRRQGWRARLAMRGSEAVAILPSAERTFGLAVDVGTTKLAAYLVDLSSGRTVAKAGAMNPQISYGEDVVSRIVHSNKGQRQRLELQSKLVETFNRLIGELCDENGARLDQVVELVAVGNTAMHHLLLGLPTHQLATAPYVPALSESIDVRAGDLGIHVAPGAYLHLPPNIAGYVGGDHVAMILATGIWHTVETIMALDIGTNTEISLASGGRLYTCSCASGPAFEGAHMRHGMRAAPGAIERVRMEDNQVRVQTIGGQPPVGICGSGILDAIAEMVSVGALDRSGRLQAAHPLIRRTQDGQLECVLVTGQHTGHGSDIVVTQKDVHELQLAKAAIQVGIQTLLQEAGLMADALDAFIVAGAFGTYIDIGSAIAVKMFPALPRDRFRQIGNAAGAGARHMLVSAQARQTAAGVPRRVNYIELAKHPCFSEAFLEALYL